MISNLVTDKILIGNEIVVGKDTKSMIEMAAGEPLPPSLCIPTATGVTAWSVAPNTKRQSRAGG